MLFLSKTVQHLTTVVFILYIICLVTVISRGMWPHHSSYLNPCNFSWWYMLKEKLYRNSFHTKGGLKENIQDVVFSASPAEL
jgi:hypothetical protein